MASEDKKIENITTENELNHMSSSSEDHEPEDENAAKKAFQKNVEALLSLKDAITESAALNESLRSPVKPPHLSGSQLDNFLEQKIAEIQTNQSSEPLKNNQSSRASSRAKRRQNWSGDTDAFRASVEPLKNAFYDQCPPINLSSQNSSICVDSKQVKVESSTVSVIKAPPAPPVHVVTRAC